MISPDAFAAQLQGKSRLFLAGFGGEPTAVIEALIRNPLRGADVRVTGVFIPGVNRVDLSALAPAGNIESYFVTPALRAPFAAGRVLYRPMHYTAIYAELLTRKDFDVAIVRVSPQRNGRVSLGIAHDFTPALLASGVPIAAMVDPDMPYVADGITIPVSQLMVLIDGPSPPITLPPDPLRTELAEIARFTRELVRDGDVVQTGIGSAPNAVLAALRDHSRLRLHGGMVTDAGLALLEAGVATEVTTGVAACTADRTRNLAHERRVHFRPVSATHGAAALAAIPNLVAINSALDIDLFGQLNGEMIAGRQISGHGGLADFVRGARASVGGRSIIVLGASGERGKVSRITPVLPAGTPVAITRADIDIVVTEFGVAQIRDTDLDTRAARLIAIAAPGFRDALANSWDALRRAM